jgi:hypothetical protein
MIPRKGKFGKVWDRHHVDVPEDPNDAGPAGITLAQLQLLFAILGVGMGSSAVLFLLEVTG